MGARLRTLRVPVPGWGGHNGTVGFDATRQQRRKRSDPWVVAAAVAVCVLLVLWALLA